MNLLKLFRRANTRPSQLIAELAVPQHELPTGKHREIMNDLVRYGASEGEALAIVAKSATRNWHGATGNYTRGRLAEGQINATEGRLGGAQ